MKFSVFRKTDRHPQVGEPKRNPCPAYSFMMDCFLKSRTESGNPSNIEYDEEDVNVYIVNLLCLLMDPVYYLQIHKYIADYDVDIFHKVEKSMDRRLRYWVYKANADHLLVNLGLFYPINGCFNEGDDGNGPLFARSARTDAERGKTYYSFARSYSSSLPRLSRAVADVLGKLSYGFDKYVRILDYMRGEYFNLIDTMSEGEVFHLQRDLDKFKNRDLIRKKYDVLLDLYLEWKKTKEPRVIAEMERVLKELKALDPSCGFTIPH